MTDYFIRDSFNRRLGEHEVQYQETRPGFDRKWVSYSFMPSKTNRGYNVRSTVKTIASERIDILLRQAKEMLDRDPKLSKRYVELATKISMRTKVKIPSSDKRYICKACGTILIPGRNARVRVLTGNTRVVVTCISCGNLRKYPFRKRMPGSNLAKE